MLQDGDTFLGADMNIQETTTILNNRVCSLQVQLEAAKLAGQLEIIPAIELDLAGTKQTIEALTKASGA